MNWVIWLSKKNHRILWDKYLCYFTLLHQLENILTERVFLKSKEQEFVGLSNRWSVNETNAGGTLWNYRYKGDKYQYVVCLNKNSLLQTDRFPLPSSLNIVYANTTIQGRLCKKIHPVPAVCEEKVSVGAFIGDYEPQTTITNRDFVTFPEKKPTVDYFNISKITKYKNLQGKKYIQYVFNSNIFCGSLVNFTVFYYKCPAVKSLVTFGSNIIAPLEEDGLKRINGKCVDFSINESGDTPYIDCTWDGQGTVVSSCTCMKGHTNTSTDCQECKRDEFKSSDGNILCSKCGKNSLSNVDRTECACIFGFHREIGKENDDKAICYELPKKPTVIETIATSTEIYLEWYKDKDPDAVYIIRCTNCPPDRNIFLRITEPNVNITNLGSFAKYDLQLIVESNNTKRVGKGNPLQISVTTKRGIPGTVQDVTHTINSDGLVMLRWKPPFAKGSDVLKYLIRYGGLSRETTKTKYTIKRDRHSRSYTVTITVQAIVNGKILTGPTFTYSKNISVKGSVPVAKIIGGVVGSFIVVLLIVVAAIFIRRKWGVVSYFPNLQVFRMEDGNGREVSNRFNNGSKRYVDPTTYNSIVDAVQEFAFQLNEKQLEIGDSVGEGEFADVYKGILTKDGKSKEVAIKTLKSSASKKDTYDFLSEAAILGQFNDPNVISLQGVFLKEETLGKGLIVLEFMVNGALQKYLQIHDNQFTNLQLVKMACDVASGMKYLSGLGFIHRDLAARNILVDENRCCKVSDFGMSREVEKVNGIYHSNGNKIPMRWTAPEAIQFKKFTTASDVWSYGILLWEIMSYGVNPYCGWSNSKVLERLNQGYRLPQPMNCPEAIYELMLTCWNMNHIKRPIMNVIWNQLKLWIESPEILEIGVSNVVTSDDDLDYTVLETINKWLSAIGMDCYIKQFLDQGYSTPQQVLNLTLKDLEELGIAPIEHRKTIFKAIESTKLRYSNSHAAYINVTGPSTKTLTASNVQMCNSYVDMSNSSNN